MPDSIDTLPSWLVITAILVLSIGALPLFNYMILHRVTRIMRSNRSQLATVIVNALRTATRSDWSSINGFRYIRVLIFVLPV